MAEPFLWAIAFSLGIAWQAFLLIRGKKIDWRTLKGLMISSLVLSLSIVLSMWFLSSVETLLPSGHKKTYNPSFSFVAYLFAGIVLSFLIFSFLFVIFYKEHILPVINKQTVLVFTIAFWFITLTYAKMLLLPFSLCCGPLLHFILVCSIATLIVAFTNLNVGFELRVLFYVWFLFMALCVNLLYLYFEGTSFIDAASQKSLFSGVLEAFFTGAIFLSTFAYGGSLYTLNLFSFLSLLVFYLLKPSPISKRQSFEARMDPLKEYIELLSTKYSDSQLNPLYAFLILFGGTGLFIVNTLFHVIPDLLLLAMFITIVPWLPLSASVKKE